MFARSKGQRSAILVLRTAFILIIVRGATRDNLDIADQIYSDADEGRKADARKYFEAETF